MDLTDTDEVLAFAEEVRSFLAAEWSPDRSGDSQAERRFRAAAIARGYLYRHVPARYGGAEHPRDGRREQVIIDLFTEACAPRAVPGVGSALLVPTLLEHGTDWQKARFIPPILTGEELWAQGYSEPEAGSDLASLTTRAVRSGDGWIIDGAKIWSSNAHRARFMFALVRTEASPRHAGLSYLLIDLHQTGVTVRPIRQMTGADGFCEVRFERAVTPADWIVGAPGEGWKVSHSTLKHERDFVGSAAESRAQFDDLIRLARSRMTVEAGTGLADPVIRQRLAALEGRVEAHFCMGQHQATLAEEGRDAGALPMLNKLTGTLLMQEVWAIAADLLEEDAGVTPARERPGPRDTAQWAELGMRSLSRAIAGGTSNIQRDILSIRGLGLPKA
jgi:alkylation response protein AidB-like acyl-CoA dehydrogenase